MFLPLLNASRNGNATTSLGSLFQSLIIICLWVAVKMWRKCFLEMQGKQAFPKLPNMELKRKMRVILQKRAIIFFMFHATKMQHYRLKRMQLGCTKIKPIKNGHVYISKHSKNMTSMLSLPGQQLCCDKVTLNLSKGLVSHYYTWWPHLYIGNRRRSEVFGFT